MQQHSSSDSFERVFTNKEKSSLGGELFMTRELVDIDLSGADLRGALFERTTLVRCNLTAADVRGAQFVHCEFRDVVLTDVRFEDNRFDGTIIIDAVGLSATGRARIQEGGGSFQHVLASRR